jgi:hypothetical protein
VLDEGLLDEGLLDEEVEFRVKFPTQPRKELWCGELVPSLRTNILRSMNRLEQSPFTWCGPSTCRIQGSQHSALLVIQIGRCIQKRLLTTQGTEQQNKSEFHSVIFT